MYEAGEKYVGQWKDGMKHGQGIFYWRNGARYEGSWKRDEHHGEGTYHRKHMSNSLCLKEAKKTYGESFEQTYKELQIELDNGIDFGDVQGQTIKGLWNQGSLVEKIHVV